MATENVATAEDPQTATEAGPKPSMLSKLAVLGFIVLVIAVECLVAYYFLPSASATAAHHGAAADEAGEKASHKSAKEGGHGKGENRERNHAEMEVQLGEFSLTAYQPASNAALRIDFRLCGTVRPEDEKELTRMMDDNKHRFREQVLVTVRGADIADLTEAGLSLVKRKILDKSNRMFGKPLLQSVIFSDFSFVEQ